MTAFPDMLYHLGGVPVGGLPLTSLQVFRVDGVYGNDGNNGMDRPFQTIQKAVDQLFNIYSNRGVVMIEAKPGGYAESVTISRKGGANPCIMLVGTGVDATCADIRPSAANATALTVHEDHVALINLDLEGKSGGTGSGLINDGSYLRAFHCKIENGTDALVLGPGTAAQVTAVSRGTASDCSFENCEFCWSSSSGVNLKCTDFGAITEARFTSCRFHDLDKHVKETVGSGGSAAVMFQNLLFEDCTFQRAEGGAQPTAYILLNGNNANDGVITRCSFPTAINGGKNLVSTLLLWVSNFHTGGVSTAQPS